jgi:hypothetical protein
MLKGKSLLITGGATAKGTAVAEWFAKWEACPAVADLSEPGVADVTVTIHPAIEDFEDNTRENLEAESKWIKRSMLS